jgi:hypothetical protein
VEIFRKIEAFLINVRDFQRFARLFKGIFIKIEAFAK